MSDIAPVVDVAELTEGVVGKVDITWYADGSAMVSSDALEFQGAMWKVAAYFRKAPEGWWFLDSDRHAKLDTGPPVTDAKGGSVFSRAGADNTVFGSVVVALTVALDSAWTPERQKAAALAAADREVEESNRKLRRLYVEVAEAEAAHRDLLTRYASIVQD